MDAEIMALIFRRRRQFLVHSFLYYVLDESIISDSQYDKLCTELVELQRRYPEIASVLPYHDICSQLDESASGSYIKREQYPEGIITTAFHLLASEKGESLQDLVARHGYKLLSQNYRSEP